MADQPNWGFDTNNSGLFFNAVTGQFEPLNNTNTGFNASTNSGVGQAPNIRKITLSSTGRSAPDPVGGANSSIRSSAGSVTFYVSPEIEESGQTNYIAVDEIRAPASLLIWMGSPSRTFNINAKLLSRTAEEAQANWTSQNLLRAWRMPLGKGAAQSAVPEVITLNGYGFQFNSIPTIMKSVNIQFPVDVDYITTGGFSIPIIMPVSIVLQEYHTIDELRGFDYDSYKAGTLGNLS